MDVRSRHYKVGDPFSADMLAKLNQLREGPAIDGRAVGVAIRRLTVAQVVMAGWDAGTIAVEAIERSGPQDFEISLTKDGVPLNASAHPSAGRTYAPPPNNHAHTSRAIVESRWVDRTMLAKALQQARIAPGVDPALRDEAVALLLEPTIMGPEPLKSQDQTR